jgi:hypothetical protein
LPDDDAMIKRHITGITRRCLLESTAALAVGGFGPPALGRTYRGGSLPWEPNDTTPPNRLRPGPWVCFTADEAASVEAIVDRLIPPDDSGPGVSRLVVRSLLIANSRARLATPGASTCSRRLPRARPRKVCNHLSYRGSVALQISKEAQVLNSIVVGLNDTKGLPFHCLFAPTKW